VVEFLGLAIAWKWELAGGAMTLGAMLIGALTIPGAFTIPGALFILVNVKRLPVLVDALLFLYCGWMSRAGKDAKVATSPKEDWAVRSKRILYFLIAPLMLSVVGVCVIEIGLSLILLLGSFVAFVAWGLWGGRAWARQLAIVSHGAAAIAALSVTIWGVVVFLNPGHSELHAPVNLVGLIVAGIGFGGLILAIHCLRWFWRTRDSKRTAASDEERDRGSANPPP
jgi:hypothetical protein